MTVDRRTFLAGCAGASLLRTAPVAAQGFAGLGRTSDGFALPSPDTRLTFPQDHGPHPAFRIEWWYVTANLDAPDGTPMGAQWTLFRTALRPPDSVSVETPWASQQVWFAHAAITTPDAHFGAQTYARGGIGQAGATAAPFAAWINDWAMEGHAAAVADQLSRLSVTATGADFAYDLALAADGPLVLHGRPGEKGYSVKSPRGQASHYYAQPHYRVQGDLTLPDGPMHVTGRAWLDREWSSSPLAPTQSGWDWFALHFAEGWKLMIYRLRDTDGPAFTPATFIADDGASTYVENGAITLTELATTRIHGGDVPTRWRIEWPAREVDITVAAVNPTAFMETDVPYWEGPVTMAGSHDGEGYLEMTGYV